MVAAVKGVVALARRAAQRRGQEPSTAHLLLVMLHGRGAAARLLAEHGVREVDLLGALRVLEGESQATLERAFDRAREIAIQERDDRLDELHLLLAVLRDGRSAASRCLEAIGASPARIQSDAAAKLGCGRSGGSARGRLPLSLTAQRQGARRVAPPTSLPKASAGSPSKPRPSKGAPPPQSRPALGTSPSAQAPRAKLPGALAGAGLRSPNAPRPNIRRARAQAPDDGASLGALDPARFPLLTTIGRDLRALAEAGAIDPVIGRDAEIEQLLDVLSRRRSNNPILVGAPGVGKTAIVEGLALRLAEGGEGVCGLEDRLLIELSAGGLVAGTGVRGALSERLRQLKEEVALSEGRVVLFIDEIHAIVGGAEGPDELANELKASLARGELPCIGATTEAEYRKYFERDAALARRFSPIHVEEPSSELAIAIVSGVAPRYAAHHGVAIDDEAVEASVELSTRYLSERQLPDKAVGVLDQAAARAKRRGHRQVDREAVANVIAEQARVPIERLLSSDGERLVRLESILAERIVGHQEPLSRIADTLRKSAAGLSRGGPLASFMLLGPTGVGKTETARAIHEVFFPGSPMTHLDMSELSESHSVARLIGAPPGYLGHEQGGQLTEAVRGRPYQLVLLDEIDKAHPQVWMTLLPLLEEGQLTDGRGRRVDFRNTIVVMTSNFGVEARSSARIGFGSDDGRATTGAILERARRALPPELWNRIDEPLVFGPLGVEEIAQIAERRLGRLADRLEAEHGIRLELDGSAIEALIDAGGYDPELGARPMRRTIARLVESKLAKALVSGRYRRGDRLQLRAEGGSITIASLTADHREEPLAVEPFAADPQVGAP